MIRKVTNRKLIISGKYTLSFNFSNELRKIKVVVPLKELIQVPTFSKYLKKVFEFPSPMINEDSLKLNDELPHIIVGRLVEDQNNNVPPFYINLLLHDQLLHNCMLDSGASDNLMHNLFVKTIGLEITWPYKYIYTFDSQKAHCLSMIRDVVVNLAQIPSKTIMMDVVLADVPVNYIILLSISWGAKLGGSLQLDIYYTSILVFKGKTWRLYREERYAYTISDLKKLYNHSKYSTDDDMGNYLLAVNVDVLLEDNVEIDNQEL